MNVENDIKACTQELNNGNLILYPTDTIWGVGCDATNAEAVSKIYKLKQREDEKAMIILLADVKDLLKYITQLPPNIFNFITTLKSPTTIIYDGAINIAENLINADGTVAIRIVTDDFCKQLIKRFRKPIVSTSANISGEIHPKNFNEIVFEIKNGVDYIVQHHQNYLSAARPSTIIKLNKDGSFKTIRN